MSQGATDLAEKAIHNSRGEVLMGVALVTKHIVKSFQTRVRNAVFAIRFTV